MCRRTRGEILSDMKTYSDFDEKSAEFFEDEGLMFNFIASNGEVFSTS